MHLIQYCTSKSHHTVHCDARSHKTPAHTIYLFLLCLYEKPALVGENSPSLWPTMSSVISTSWYIFPLCTWNTNPTKLGNIVADRACVCIGGAFWPGGTRTIGRGTMLGPFQTERARSIREGNIVPLPIVHLEYQPHEVG